MASAEEEEKERAVFDDDDGDDSEEEEEEEDDDDDTDDDLPAAAAAAAAPPPPASPMEAERHTDSTADADDGAPTTSGAKPNRNRNPNPNRGAHGGGAAAAEEARRLFQRLWTEEEELVILRGFSEFTTRRGTAFASHQYDTGPFYDEMRRQLPLDFSKSQLVEKLRRLKKKYLNCVARLRSAADSFAFRSPHEQALFEIARNIWTPSSDPNPDPANPIINNSDSDRKPPRLRSRRQQQRQQRRLRRATAAAAAAAAAEDPIPVPVPVPVPVPISVTVENPTPKPPPPLATPAAASDLSPLLFKELVGAAIGGPLLGFGGGSSVSNLGDGRWRKQQILELEVYLKRLELLREHIESTLRELKGSSGGA
ncbi:Mediator-associated protein 1 [Ananas comosus]|uniref:Mediator-associated protein 1 n=1 Tax=Ananas comosus TaxID=4615 RepID=A0A199UY37_ANACO|nr:Mediator-associated protein 1 [Ananas comosus]